jgi:putative membrane protein
VPAEVILMTEETQSAPAETPGPRDLRLPGALVRTALSAEQTLMSWVRTALSLFTFGFSIVQFFFFLASQQESTELSAGPRRLGLTLIVVGVSVLLMAVVEYVQRLRRLREAGLPADSTSFLPLGSAAGLLVIGLAALISVFFRWHL